MFRQHQIQEYKHDINQLWKKQLPKRVPNGSLAFSDSFSIRNAGSSITEIFNKPEIIYDTFLWTAAQYGWNPFMQFTGFSALGAIDFGGTIYYPEEEGEVIAPLSHPVTCEEDVERLHLPDPRTTGDIPRQIQFGHLQKDAGFPVTFYTRSPFCMAANMCGVGLFMKWLIRRPDLCTRIMDVALKHILNVMSYWVDTFGSENIQVWMSTPLESNQCISPKHMETFAIPYHIAYHDFLKQHGLNKFFIHICGEQNRNLQALVEADPWAHPAVLSFGPEIDILDAAKYFPDDIICGNIDTSLLQTGSPVSILNACCELLEKGKRIESGFILAPGCDTPALAPPVNIYAITRALQECGAY